MIENIVHTQYIRTTKALDFEDYRGRTTHLVEGMPGFILTEENLDEVCDNEKEREKCQQLLDQAAKKGGDRYCSVLMLQGYPCIVPIEWFMKCDEPKIYTVPCKMV